jgi:hypothetical protein
VTQENEPLGKLAKNANGNSPSPGVGDHCYTVDEVALMWKLSRDSVRRIFRSEVGVLVFSPPQRRGKRSYTTLRIPQSVLDRVRRKLAIVKVLTK